MDADVAGSDADEGETVDADQELFERIRLRLEQDADVLRWTDRKTRQQLLHRVAQLAAEEAKAEPQPATWETARTRPLATSELDDPRDVLIGNLARILDVADGGHHAASYSALLSAANRLARMTSSANEQARTPRARAVADIIPIAHDLAQVGDLSWDAAMADLRLLVINLSLRRQLESLSATVCLANSGFAHLAVSFIRPAFEEKLWVQYLVQADRDLAQLLLLNLANYDGLRSLLAQWRHLGNDEMESLWYPTPFLAKAQSNLRDIENRLTTLRRELGWQGGKIPSTSWVAEQVDELREYEYLNSATSRALHFSSGEVLRRSWGEPGGRVTTNKPEFRAHLSEFTLDQQWRLFFATLGEAIPLLEASGISTKGELDDTNVLPAIQPLLDCGRVPLVHAREWNLASPAE